MWQLQPFHHERRRKGGNARLVRRAQFYLGPKQAHGIWPCRVAERRAADLFAVDIVDDDGLPSDRATRRRGSADFDVEWPPGNDSIRQRPDRNAGCVRHDVDGQRHAAGLVKQAVMAGRGYVKLPGVCPRFRRCCQFELGRMVRQRCFHDPAGAARLLQGERNRLFFTAVRTRQIERDIELRADPDRVLLPREQSQGGRMNALRARCDPSAH